MVNRNWQPGTMTDSALNRLYFRIYRRLERINSGGLAYGMDWPTISITSPDLAQRLRDCAAELDRRGWVTA